MLDETFTTTPIIKEKPINFLDPDGWSLGGSGLKEAVQSYTGKVEMMVDGLVAKNSLNMWYASDGVGKSVLALEAALEQAHKLPVFGHLECYDRYNVIYVVGERHMNEPLHRIKIMSEKYNFDFRNFHITGKFQGYNLANEKNHLICLQTLKDIADAQFGGVVHQIYFDPLNSLCNGDMKEDSVVASLRMFLSLVMNHFNCAVTFTHHENRGHRNTKTGKREGMDFYGNKFLSTMSTSVIHIKEKHKGTIFVKEKDSYTCIYSPIPLNFDSEFFLSIMDEEHTPITKTVTILKYLNEMFAKGKTFSKYDLECFAASIELDLTNSLLNKIISSQIKSKKIVNLKSSGTNATYKVLSAIEI